MTNLSFKRRYLCFEDEKSVGDMFQKKRNVRINNCKHSFKNYTWWSNNFYCKRVGGLHREFCNYMCPFSLLSFAVRSQEVIINIEKMGMEEEERKGAGDFRARWSRTAVCYDQVGRERGAFLHILL